MTKQANCKCGKRSYTSIAEAKIAVDDYRRTVAVKLAPVDKYQCRKGLWHLGHSRWNIYEQNRLREVHARDEIIEILGAA
tara:strand:+ start:2446 stop:2685 length:240 start_codon:yes stop_codon:yes gene_type:complete